MSSGDFYLARAAACTKEAEEATLENVRRRNLDAAAVWQAMADRFHRMETARREREAEKARGPQ
jgi:hypothetical protein